MSSWPACIWPIIFLMYSSGWRVGNDSKRSKLSPISLSLSSSLIKFLQLTSKHQKNQKRKRLLIIFFASLYLIWMRFLTKKLSRLIIYENRVAWKLRRSKLSFPRFSSLSQRLLMTLLASPNDAMKASGCVHAISRIFQKFKCNVEQIFSFAHVN